MNCKIAAQYLAFMMLKVNSVIQVIYVFSNNYNKLQSVEYVRWRIGK